MTTPLSGTSSNLTPDYGKETAQVQTKKGASARAGKEAILAYDTLEVPLQAPIAPNEAEAGRPSLPPLFRTRFVEDHQIEELNREYYQMLRHNLSALLKQKLEKDEQEELTERDPDLVALDASLKFEANLLALTDTLLIPSTGDEKTLLGAQRYLALPELVRQELMNYGSVVTHFLDHYLSTIGRNDASYDLLVNVSNQIKEALALMSLNRGKNAAA
jgi:hypothetical protein